MEDDAQASIDSRSMLIQVERGKAVAIDVHLSTCRA